MAEHFYCRCSTTSSPHHLVDRVLFRRVANVAVSHFTMDLKRWRRTGLNTVQQVKPISHIIFIQLLFYNVAALTFYNTVVALVNFFLTLKLIWNIFVRFKRSAQVLLCAITWGIWRWHQQIGHQGTVKVFLHLWGFWSLSNLQFLIKAFTMHARHSIRLLFVCLGRYFQSWSVGQLNMMSYICGLSHSWKQALSLIQSEDKRTSPSLLWWVNHTTNWVK